MTKLSIRIFLPLVALIAASQLGCRTEPKLAPVDFSTRNTYAIPAKALVEAVRTAVTSPPIDLTIDNESDGRFLTGWQQNTGATVSVMFFTRHWEERTRYTILVSPALEDPVNRGTVEVSEESQQRPQPNHPWENQDPVRRQERAAKLAQELDKALRARPVAQAPAVAVPAAAAAVTPTTPAEHQVVAPVRQFVDSFNRGDTTGALAACADDLAILDDVPPHEWHGPGAASRWMTDLESFSKANAIVENKVLLGNPTQIRVTGDVGYVVVPVDYTYKKDGKPVAEKAFLTAALRRGATGWKIHAWAWTRN